MKVNNIKFSMISNKSICEHQLKKKNDKYIIPFGNVKITNTGNVKINNTGRVILHDYGYDGGNNKRWYIDRGGRCLKSLYKRLRNFQTAP